MKQIKPNPKKKEMHAKTLYFLNFIKYFAETGLKQTIFIIVFKKVGGLTFVSNFFEVSNFSLMTPFYSNHQVN